MSGYKYHTHFIAVLLAVSLTGCTSIEVKKVDAGLHRLNHVCIIDNPKVLVDDFTSVMQDIMTDHGILSEIVYGDSPKRCSYVVKYTARRSWDIVPYLAYAKVTIWKHQQLIGSAEYEHVGGSMSWALTKWDSTRIKMEPVFTEMLGGAPGEQSLAHQAAGMRVTEEFETNAQAASARPSPNCTTKSILGMKDLGLSDAQIKAACSDAISQETNYEQGKAYKSASSVDCTAGGLTGGQSSNECISSPGVRGGATAISSVEKAKLKARTLSQCQAAGGEWDPAALCL